MIPYCNILIWDLHGIVHDFFSHFKKAFDSLPLLCPSRQVDYGACNRSKYPNSWRIIASSGNEVGLWKDRRLHLVEWN